MQKKDGNTIAFSDLACKYFPNQEKRNAERNLNKWIERNVDLSTRLAEVGFMPRKHQLLTPKQHALIINFLGDHSTE